MISVYIEKLYFQSGETLELPPSGVTVIVGPNSAGKSVLLSEIVNNVSNYPHPASSLWLSSISLVRQGDRDEFSAWFNGWARVRRSSQGELQMGIFSNRHGDDFLSFERAYDGWSNNFVQVAGRMMNYLGAADRAVHSLSGPAREPGDSPSHPLHFLWDDKGFERRFSDLIKRAFGFGVCINRHTIYELTLYKGSPAEEDEPHPPTPEVIDRYARLPNIQEEGDGVRSFVRVLLDTTASQKKILVVDEPEAFLHPPQARLLGRFLVDETPPESQVIIATHSPDVLQGILDGRRDRDVNIIRLSLQGDGTRRPRVLSPGRVKSLWTNPLLRYSRMLDGLFHRGIVICEADTDCRFYSAVTDAHPERKSELDLVFTHVGGKARLAPALQDMNDFGVRAAVIGDIDVLNNADTVRQLVNAAGGDFALIEQDMKTLDSYVKSLGAGPLAKHIKDLVAPIVRRPDTTPILDSEKTAIRAALKVRSGWEEVKRGGLNSLMGRAAPAADHILDYLKGIGIFIVPVGELERWYRLDVRKGSAYVVTVLEEGLHENPSPELDVFTRELIEYFDR